ncbi:MAG: hypothetical protein R3A10_01940 [Caldilineaceae bacterium]
MLPLLRRRRPTDGLSTTLDVTVDVARHLMLLDHALANQNELTPPGMSPLPLVPFAVSMEYMAEVAATLRPGWFVRRLEKLRSYRWLAWSAGTLPCACAQCPRRRRPPAPPSRWVFTLAGDEPVLAVEGVVQMEATPPVHTQPVYTPQPQVHVDERARPSLCRILCAISSTGPVSRAIRAAHAVADDGILKSSWPSIRSSGTRPAACPPAAAGLLNCLGQSTAHILYEHRPQTLCALPLPDRILRAIFAPVGRRLAGRSAAMPGSRRRLSPPRWVRQTA